MSGMLPNLAPTPMSKSDYATLSHMLKPQKADIVHYDQACRDDYRGSYTAGSEEGFENYAFAKLFDDREYLGIEKLLRCSSARADGACELASAVARPPETMLIEMKTTLGWGTLNAALGALLTGESLLRSKGKIAGARQGLIVFSQFSRDWSRKDPDPLRPWAQLYRHLEELKDKFELSALQLRPDGFYNPFLNHEVEDGRIRRLFRPYEQ